MPYTTLINTHLTGLKHELQELESAVQEPCDEESGCIMLLAVFPPVVKRFKETFFSILQQMQEPAVSDSKLFSVAAENGWLKGDLSVWNTLDFYSQTLSDFQNLQADLREQIIRDVRRNSFLLWQTFETLNMKFRNGHVRSFYDDQVVSNPSL